MGDPTKTDDEAGTDSMTSSLTRRSLADVPAPVPPGGGGPPAPLASGALFTFRGSGTALQSVYANFHAVAVLYKAGALWARGDAVAAYPFQRPLILPSPGLLATEIEEQIYVDPVSITITRGDLDRWILIVSLGSGAGSTSGENRQGHAWRIETPEGSAPRAAYLGAFGGATSTTPANAMAVPPAGTVTPVPADNPTELLLSAPFALTSTLTQPVASPTTWAAALQIGFGFTITSGNTPITFNPSLQGQIGGGCNFNQSTLPAPTFVVTFNVFVTAASPGGVPGPGDFPPGGLPPGTAVV